MTASLGQPSALRQGAQCSSMTKFAGAVPRFSSSGYSLPHSRRVKAHSPPLCVHHCQQLPGVQLSPPVCMVCNSHDQELCQPMPPLRVFV